MRELLDTFTNIIEEDNDEDFLKNIDKRIKALLELNKITVEKLLKL